MGRLKKLLFLFLLLTSVFTKAQETRLFPYVTQEGKWGFMNKDKRIKVRAHYDTVSIFQHGYAVTYRNNQWRIINQEGKITGLFRCDSIDGVFFKFGSFSLLDCYEHPVIEVYRDGNYHYIDTAGQKVRYSYCDEDDYDWGEEDDDGLHSGIKVSVQDRERKYGFKHRNINISIIYDTLIPWFTEVTKEVDIIGRKKKYKMDEYVFIVKSNHQYGLLTRRGDTIISITHPQFLVSKFKPEIWFGSLEEGIRLYQTDGQAVFQQAYHIRDDIENPFLIFHQKGKYGVINKSEEVMIPTIFDTLYRCGFHYLIAEKGDSTYIYSKETALLTKVKGYHHFRYDYGNKLFIVTHQGKDGLLNKEGQLALAPKYHKLVSIPYSKNIGYWNKKKKAGIMDIKGKKIIKARYEKVLRGYPSYYLVHHSGVSFYVHQNGNEFCIK